MEKGRAIEIAVFKTSGDWEANEMEQLHI